MNAPRATSITSGWLKQKKPADGYVSSTAAHKPGITLATGVEQSLQRRSLATSAPSAASHRAHGTHLLWGEQSAQMQRPHARQWCRRRSRPNSARQSSQAAASESGVHRGCRLAAWAGTGGVMRWNSVGGSEPSRSARRRRWYRSAAGVWYRDSRGTASHTFRGTPRDGSARNSSKRALPPRSMADTSFSFSTSSFSDRTKET